MVAAEQQCCGRKAWTDDEHPDRRHEGRMAIERVITGELLHAAPERFCGPGEQDRVRAVVRSVEVEYSGSRYRLVRVDDAGTGDAVPDRTDSITLSSSRDTDGGRDRVREVRTEPIGNPEQHAQGDEADAFLLPAAYGYQAVPAESLSIAPGSISYLTSVWMRTAGLLRKEEAAPSGSRINILA